MKTIVLPVILLMIALSLQGQQISFTTQATPSTAQLLGISFADAGTGYACGNGGVILKTTNGGASWISLTTGTSEDLSDIRVMPGSNGQKVIAVGDNNTAIKSVNGGATWISQSIPFQTGSFLFGVQCLDTLHYFACGGDYATLSGAVVRTSDGGATWTSEPVPGSVFLDKIFMRSQSYGFVAGTHTSFSDGSVHKTTAQGSWPLANSTSSLLTNVWCNSNANIVCVGLSGQILRSADGGSSWTSHGINATDLYGLQFADSLHGYACGGDPSSNMILATSNGGNSWTQINHPFAGSFNALCVVNQAIYLAGNQGTIIKGAIPNATYTAIADRTYPLEELSLCPNPASDQMTITIAHPNDRTQLLVINGLGGICRQAELCSTNTALDLKGLAPGIYFYKFVSEGKTLKTGKLVIQN